MGGNKPTLAAKSSRHVREVWQGIASGQLGTKLDNRHGDGLARPTNPRATQRRLIERRQPRAGNNNAAPKVSTG